MKNKNKVLVIIILLIILIVLVTVLYNEYSRKNKKEEKLEIVEKKLKSMYENTDTKYEYKYKKNNKIYYALIINNKKSNLEVYYDLDSEKFYWYDTNLKVSISKTG